MSGHSKFANIKHKKEKNDAAKGKVFTKIGREIAVAVKEGSKKQPETEMLTTTNTSYTKDTDRTELQSSLMHLLITVTVLLLM